jgi:hypothetical protein
MLHERHDGLAKERERFGPDMFHAIFIVKFAFHFPLLHTPSSGKNVVIIIISAFFFFLGKKCKRID